MAARPSNLTRPDISNSDAVLIVKEHQNTGGSVWAVACTGQLTLALLQCGFDGACSSNGTVVAQNPVCLQYCSCATEGTLDSFKPSKLRGQVGRAHNGTLLAARAANLTMTNSTVANYTAVIHTIANLTATNITATNDTAFNPKPVGRLGRVLRAHMNSTQATATLVNATLTNTTLVSST